MTSMILLLLFPVGLPNGGVGGGGVGGGGGGADAAPTVVLQSWWGWGLCSGSVRSRDKS